MVLASRISFLRTENSIGNSMFILIYKYAIQGSTPKLFLFEFGS